MVAEIPGNLVGVVLAGDALAIEEEIHELHVVAGVGLHEGVAAGAVPVDGAIGLHDALAVAVVSVIDASGGG
jgi:hypothetical protein